MADDWTKWQTVENLHSCEFCERIDFGEDFSSNPQGMWTARVEIAMAEIREAAKTCPLFAFITEKFERANEDKRYLTSPDWEILNKVLAASSGPLHRGFERVRDKVLSRSVTQSRESLYLRASRWGLAECYMSSNVVEGISLGSSQDWKDPHILSIPKTDHDVAQASSPSWSSLSKKGKRDSPATPSNLDTYYFPAVNSTFAFTSAIAWIEDCTKTHTECHWKSSRPVMRRLLDVFSHNQNTVHLVETSDLPLSQVDQWAALSYCWGGDQPLKTTRDSIASHYKGIPLKLLPHTLLDAVLACRRIGVSYLWVDSLCIIQDDERDLERELSQMPHIYQGALVTIYASAAGNVHDGFLSHRPFYYDQFPPVKLRLGNSERHKVDNYLVLAEPVYGSFGPSYKRDDPLDRRAWAYQERMLSPRRLIFSSRELTWQCRHGPRRIGDTRDPYGEITDDNHNIWSEYHDFPCVPGTDMPSWEFIVGKYTKCSLSLPSDKLVAIAGIADVYQKEHDLIYLAGLWKEDLPEYLCWHMNFGRRQNRPNEYRAPSWSWASVDGEIRWYGKPHEYTKEATVIEAVTSPLFPAVPLAAVTGGWLTIRGRLVPATLKFYVGENDTTGRPELTGFPIFEAIKVELDAMETSWHCETANHMVELEVWLMLIMSYKGITARTKDSVTGLVLQKVEEETYRRIGLFHTFTESEKPWNEVFPRHSPEVEIRIE